MTVRIEPADEADLPAVLEIYNREIREGVALWNTAERELAEMAAWRADRLAGGYPVVAAREGGALLGFGAFGPFRPHDGYRHSVEHSLYVAPAAQRRGVGRALLGALIEIAQGQGRHAMIGGMAAENMGSAALHRAFGFLEVARLPEVGRKFDRWLTLVLMQKQLS